MRVFLILILGSVLLYACSDPIQTPLAGDNTVDSSTASDNFQEDTLKVGSLDYSNKTKLYFVIHGKDTSDFQCRFAKSLEGRVGMTLSFHSSMSYQEQRNELLLILPAANLDYKLDSLSFVYPGRLFSTGDLAIEVTNQYYLKNKKFPSAVTNKEISEFLLTSKLVEEINSVLKPYSIKVSTISSEKAFFAERKYLYSMSKIETDSAKVPEKVLDAQIWINLK